MSQRHYLLNTDLGFPDFQVASKLSPHARVIEVAECVGMIPLPWFACFQSSDLRPCTVQMSSEDINMMVPCLDLDSAISNLKGALPLFKEFTGESEYAVEYWQCAVDDLTKLSLPFLMMDISEMLMNSEPDGLVVKLTTALGRTSEAIAMMKTFFLTYSDGVLPYRRAAFYANQEITDPNRTRNAIALDAAIRADGFTRNLPPPKHQNSQSPAPIAPSKKRKVSVAVEDSHAMYKLACKYQDDDDYESAIVWYGKAIEIAEQSQSKSTSMFENGSAAMCNLADKYEHGLGVPRDFQLAIDWYTKSAAKENCVAQYSLGMMKKNGCVRK